uniref:Uncharacterized protein n=1 Tax=Arundo donax TaxID=35708 RepID=A0A0A9EE30_ARUDO
MVKSRNEVGTEIRCLLLKPTCSKATSCETEPGL